MKKLLILATLCLVSSPALAFDNDKATAYAETRIQQLDIDADGKISHDEYLSNAENKFKDNDTDHDGFLSHDEFVALKTKEMQNITTALGYK